MKKFNELYEDVICENKDFTLIKRLYNIIAGINNEGQMGVDILINKIGKDVIKIAKQFNKYDDYIRSYSNNDHYVDIDEFIERIKLGE